MSLRVSKALLCCDLINAYRVVLAARSDKLVGCVKGKRRDLQLVEILCPDRLNKIPTRTHFPNRDPAIRKSRRKHQIGRVMGKDQRRHAAMLGRELPLELGTIGIPQLNVAVVTAHCQKVTGWRVRAYPKRVLVSKRKRFWFIVAITAPDIGAAIGAARDDFGQVGAVGHCANRVRRLGCKVTARFVHDTGIKNGVNKKGEKERRESGHDKTHRTCDAKGRRRRIAFVHQGKNARHDEQAQDKEEGNRNQRINFDIGADRQAPQAELGKRRAINIRLLKNRHRFHLQEPEKRTEKSEEEGNLDCTDNDGPDHGNLPGE